MRTPFSELFHKGLVGSLGVEKVGTSAGADRGWETRRGRAPVEDTPGEGRERAAETPAGVPTGVSAPETGYSLTRSVLDNANTVRAANKDNSLITDMSMLGGENNVGNVYLVDFQDGTKVVYKPTSETGLTAGELGMPIRTSLDEAIPESAREEAIYHLSEAMGMSVVPHVERVNFARAESAQSLRRDALSRLAADKWALYEAEEKQEHPDDEYMDLLAFEAEQMEEWAEQVGDESRGAGHTMAYVTGDDGQDVDFEDFRRDVGAGHPDLHRIAALDIITGNTDRHMANIRRGDDGRWYAIDNGLALPIDSDHVEVRVEILDKYLQGTEIPEGVRREIAALDTDHLTQTMTKAGFSEVDVTGAKHRLAVMQQVKRWPKSERMGSQNPSRSTRKLLEAAETEHAMSLVEGF